MKRKLYAAFGKRLLDLCAGVPLLLAALPVIAVAAAAIKLEDRGPVFFRQARLGRRAKVFRVIKLRTMTERASQGAGRRLHPEDPEITAVGRWLRRFSIDELPQLFNVLTGEMSLVGPRPTLPRDLARYDERQKRRFEVRPGVTGLAQISGRASIPWSRRLALDVEYVERMDLFLDVRIMLATPGALTRAESVYPVGDPWAEDAAGDDGEPS